MSKVIFLDRDGTVNVEKNYLYKIEDFEFIQGVPEAIKILNDNDYRVIIITNQAGVARGYYTEDDVKKLHLYIQDELKKHGAYIDHFYYCPHHPTAGIGKYKKVCECRKPSDGLYRKAMGYFDVDIHKSFVVGDKISDLIPGKKLNLKTVLVKTGYGESQKDKKKEYDYLAENLLDFVANILNLKGMIK